VANPGTLTTVLAVWGAFLSSVTFGWNLFRDFNDRAKVRFEANVRTILPRIDGAFMAVNPGLLPPEERTNINIVVTVANVGRRPLRWVGFGGSYRTPVNGKSGFMLNARYLPRTLQEAEVHDEYAEVDLQLLNDNIQSLYIWDSFDRKWFLKRRNLRQLVKDARQYKCE
jgi:hypothetical protein